MQKAITPKEVHVGIVGACSKRGKRVARPIYFYKKIGDAVKAC
jgi:hypothetical protein